MLEICKSGPCDVCVGECATFNIQLTNCGNFRADDVVITDIVPPGLCHSSGKKELKLNVGCLAPGETTTASIQLVAETGGRHCNVARATSCDGRVVEAQACVDVIVPAVKIVKTGPSMQFLEKCAEYTITVTNTGDGPLENLMVYDYIPAGNCLVDAPGACVDCNTASWSIPCLNCGASACFNIVLTADCPGCYTNEACVKGNFRSCQVCECAALTTEWRGYPAFLTKVVDVCDPLLVGEATDYIIEITNQGTAADTNIRVTAYLPEQVDFVKAEGATPFTASQKVVTFDPVPMLRPGETVGFKIKARAVMKGSAHFEVRLRSDVALTTDLIEQESTQVF
ncbi:hypothetical protein AYO37_01295 [Opitutia bacterium SCGC AG-212-L18]|nr:hypothetical protein AYO37_01295 [Opitutae bacterium SCGC AG-212-L18]